MPDESEMLSFRLSTENLNVAIEILRKLGGLGEYPAAYQALVLSEAVGSSWLRRVRSASNVGSLMRCRTASSGC